jgi:hypothetical protein
MPGLRLPSAFAIKAGFGAIGLGTGIVGMALELRWLVWIAVGLLLVAFLLRFADKKRGAADPEGPRSEHEEAPEC